MNAIRGSDGREGRFRMTSPNEAAELTRQIKDAAKEIANNCASLYQGLCGGRDRLSPPCIQGFHAVIEVGMREFIERKIQPFQSENAELNRDLGLARGALMSMGTNACDCNAKANKVLKEIGE